MNIEVRNKIKITFLPFHLSRAKENAANTETTVETKTDPTVTIREFNNHLANGHPSITFLRFTIVGFSGIILANEAIISECGVKVLDNSQKIGKNHITANA